MSVYIYRSTDTSAPILNGTAGSLINVLDACLVDGYLGKSSLGQSKSYSGTNLAVYRAAVGSRMYLAVDDTGTQGARVRAFESISSAWASSMTNIVNQCGAIHPVPTDLQVSGGLFMYKSSAASAVARPQVLISNGRIFYLQVDSNSDGGSASRVLCFGDIYPYYSNDQNPCILISSITANYYNYFASICNMTGTLADHYLARKYDGLGWSISSCGKSGLLSASGSPFSRVAMGYNTGYGVLYPDPIVGGIILSPIIVYEVYGNGIVIRGRMPGLQTPCHSYPFLTGDVITGGVGTKIAGRVFETFRGVNYQDSHTGCFLIETSNTWEIENFR